MLDRYFITLGAPTTAGGKVTSANHFDTIDDVPIALEGDTCWCPACLSEGIIRPDGPRLSDTFEGRELALADDLCLCQCSLPPRLIAAQTLMYQSIDSDQYEDDAAAAAGIAAQANAFEKTAPPADSLPLALIDPDTREPLQHLPYRLELADKVIEGTLDHPDARAPVGQLPGRSRERPQGKRQFRGQRAREEQADQRSLREAVAGGQALPVGGAGGVCVETGGVRVAAFGRDD